MEEGRPRESLVDFENPIEISAGIDMSDPFKKSNSKDHELSSDSSIEALVDKGMQNAYTIAEKTMKENL